MEQLDTMAGLVGRVERLEAAMADLGKEVMTRRLVVTGDGGERIVGEVVGTTAELRMDVAGPHGSRDLSVLVFASAADQECDLGPGGGVQIWSAGDVVHELAVWRDEEDDLS